MPPEQTQQISAGTIQIRPPELHEAGAIAALLQQVFAWTYHTAIPPNVLDRFLVNELSEPAVTAELRLSNVCYQIAATHTTIIGVSRLQAGAPSDAPDSDGWIELAKCYVDPTYHGQGVAGRLLTAACATAQQAGFRQIWLCVWEHNPRAIAFYRKHGFVVDGMMPIYVEDIRFSDLVMRRGLDD